MNRRAGKGRGLLEGALGEFAEDERGDEQGHARGDDDGYGASEVFNSYARLADAATDHQAVGCSAAAGEQKSEKEPGETRCGGDEEDADERDGEYNQSAPEAAAK